MKAQEIEKFARKRAEEAFEQMGETGRGRTRFPSVHDTRMFSERFGYNSWEATFDLSKRKAMRTDDDRDPADVFHEAYIRRSWELVRDHGPARLGAGDRISVIEFHERADEIAAHGLRGTIRFADGMDASLGHEATILSTKPEGDGFRVRFVVNRGHGKAREQVVHARTAVVVDRYFERPWKPDYEAPDHVDLGKLEMMDRRVEISSHLDEDPDEDVMWLQFVQGSGYLVFDLTVDEAERIGKALIKTADVMRTQGRLRDGTPLKPGRYIPVAEFYARRAEIKAAGMSATVETTSKYRDGFFVSHVHEIQEVEEGYEVSYVSPDSEEETRTLGPYTQVKLTEHTEHDRPLRI